MAKRRSPAELAVDACFTAALLAIAVAVPWLTHVPPAEVAALWLSALAAAVLAYRVGGPVGLVVFATAFFGGAAAVELSGGNGATWPVPWAAAFFAVLGATRLVPVLRSGRAGRH